MKSIPVIMFHSVRPPAPSWLWRHLSCPPDLFEAYLRYLKSKGYTTVLLPDVLAYIHGGKELPGRSIALTFDDGYLDNWTVAAPLLKKYGFCGTVFVNPGFVDPRDLVREHVNCTSVSEAPSDLLDGFMSWNELKEAQSAGILDVQSHAMTHTWYPSSDEILDFHHPGDCYPWLTWNARPERKHLWLAEDQSEFVDFGVPVYAHEKSLIVRRYFEPEELNTKLAAVVRESGGRDFFKRQNWRDVLREAARKLPSSERYESEDEYRARVEWELATSREEIESRLGKRVDIICWPGGGHNEVTQDIARKVGYVGWTMRALANLAGRASPEIGRESVPILKLGRASGVVNRLAFVYKVEACRGTPFWRQARWLVRCLYAVPKLLKRTLGRGGP